MNHLTTPMPAFHGDPKIKAKFLRRMRAHAMADEIVQGKYWEHGKGCLVGCATHNPQGGVAHQQLEKEANIPLIISRLADRIFEGLPNAKAKAYPVRFFEAAEPGADLATVWPRFAVWMLVDPTDGVIQFAKTDATRKAIRKVADLYERLIAGDAPSDTEWSEARQQAAAYAAAYAAYAAAYAAYAAYAADAAAYAAADAAYADAAYAAAAYAAAARKKFFGLAAEKLLTLMAEAPVLEVSV